MLRIKKIHKITTDNLAHIAYFHYLCNMDLVFKEFIAKAKRMGLCEEYTDKVDHAGSKRAFIDIAIDANGLSWVATAVAKGMLSGEYIASTFPMFLNGAYIRSKDGYTSALYCRFEKDISISTTAALIIECDKDIVVDRPACELYIVNSQVRITGSGNAAVYLYNSSVINSATAPAIIIEKYGDSL